MRKMTVLLTLLAIVAISIPALGASDIIYDPCVHYIANGNPGTVSWGTTSEYSDFCEFVDVQYMRYLDLSLQWRTAYDSDTDGVQDWVSRSGYGVSWTDHRAKDSWINSTRLYN